MTQSYITMWRKTGEQCLDWDHHVSYSIKEAQHVVTNIKAQGVHQYSTRALGERIADLSSEY